MTEPTEPTCCELACYEDPGCTCPGCFADADAEGERRFLIPINPDPVGRFAKENR